MSDLHNLIQSAIEECRPEKPEVLDHYMRLAAALKPAPVSQGAGTVCPECASEDRCGIERGSTHVCHGAKPDREGKP